MPAATSPSEIPSESTTNVSESTRLRGTTRSNVDNRWSVAVAAGFIAFFGVASMSNLGFFYVYFLEEFHTNRENASWPGSVLQIMGHVAGIIVAVLQRFLSTFYIGLLGSVILWVGLLCAVLAPNIAWMTVTFGFVHGTGVGIIMVTVIVSIMSHFKKYRGLAAGFKYTGNTLASLLLPKVLSSLQDVFTFRGTLLIYAALSMHTTAFTLFLKDRQHRKTPTLRASIKEKDTRTDLCSEPIRALSEGALINGSFNNLEKTSARQDGLIRSNHVTSPAVDLNSSVHLPGINKRTQNEEEPAKYFQEAAGKTADNDAQAVSNIENVFSKTANLGAIGLIEKPQYRGEGGVDGKKFVSKEEYHLASDEYRMLRLPKNSKQISNTRKSSGTSEKWYGIRNDNAEQPPLEEESSALPPFGSKTCNSSNLQLFASPTFYVLVLGAIAADFTTVIVHATIVDYALDKGVARKSAEMSMTYCSSTELLGRLLLPLAADLGFLSRTNLVAICFTAMVVTSIALPHTASFVSYIPVQVATALFLACVATLKGVLVADSFGPDAVPTFWGANGIALIPVLIGNPFITGYFRDTMGSYDNLFRLLAGVQLFTAVVFYTLAFFQRKQNTLPS